MRSAREFWAMGDYTPIGELISELGRDLVAACPITPGQRVLDVGAGTGNAAIVAAERGAEVVAADVTPELLAIGQRLAAKKGLELEWREADAQRMPFADGEFDVVLSCVGAMFAPDHEATADELLRVCRGTVAMANWTPGGSAGAFFDMLGRHSPAPPPGASRPTAWGEPEHVRLLLGRPGVRLETAVRNVRLTFDGTPRELFEVYRDNFAPVLAVREGLDAEGAVAFDRDLLAFTTTENRAAPGEPVHYEYEYLLVLATKADGPDD
ncbi:class I SAM-dependent methyltransferase [Nonomuraea sp. LPB2021202275-12-8]|uniref:class I SAM-dependent methyltransferase n=1 Tax=Nonomuraea sp. LPB2021202275-12-8 TaxID=3120159 RepID=UPI00300CBFD5